MATCGYKLCFHGAFGTRAKADAKRRGKRGARILVKKIRGTTRYIVATEKRS